MASYCQDRHGLAVHLVAHQVRKRLSTHLRLPASSARPAERRVREEVNRVKDFGAKSIYDKLVPCLFPTKGAGNVFRCLGR